MKLLLVLVLFFSLSNTSFSQNKEVVFNDLLKKYGDINTIEILSKSYGKNVSLKAKKGNKFIMDIDELQSISNGKKVWSYNKKRKFVIVSNYDDCSQESVFNLSLDNFFFNVVQNLFPISLSSVTSTNSGKQNLLKLQNKDKLHDIREVNLWLNDKMTKIEEIEVITNDFSQKFQISKLEINQNFPDTIFEFQIPTDVEVIEN